MKRFLRWLFRRPRPVENLYGNTIYTCKASDPFWHEDEDGGRTRMLDDGSFISYGPDRWTDARLMFNEITERWEKVPENFPLSASRYPFDAAWEDHLDRETYRLYRESVGGSNEPRR